MRSKVRHSFQSLASLSLLATFFTPSLKASLDIPKSTYRQCVALCVQQT